MSTLITGSGGGGKGRGGSARAAQESPDSLRSRAYARVLDLVSEGEIEGLVDGLKSVYLDETPIENPDGSLNFTGVTLHTRNGSQHQAYVPGFSAVENEINVNVELKASQPVIRSIAKRDIDALRVKVSLPSLTRQNTSNGDLLGSVVSISIDLQNQGAGFREVVKDTISGKTTSRYQRSYYVKLSGAGPWQLRVRRLTPDSTLSSLQDRTYVESYTEIIETKLRYPNSALVGLRVDAAQFASIPRRSYDLKLLRIRVPSNYNPTTRNYTGVWDGTFKVAWSDNPAWCFYDLLTNDRYGLGHHIPQAQIDKWALYQAGQYCDARVPDGRGGFEPRFTCNLYLQTREQAYKVVQDLASVFRAMVYWSGGAITVSQDAPSDPVFQFAPANVIDGEFAYQGSSAKARHTVAMVSWNDPLDFYRQKVEYVEDLEGIARYGVVQTEVFALGCTSQGQAHRVGKWLLYSEQSESEVVSFRTGLQAAVVRPGDVVKIADPGRAGVRLAGRILRADESTITLDQDAPSGAWRLSVMMPDGKLKERNVRSTCSAAVTLEQPYPAAPLPGSIWLLSSTQVEPQLFRVLSVGETESGVYEILALAHNSSKYNAIEYGWALQPREISLLSAAPLPPASLKVTESLYRLKNEAHVLIQISWEQVYGAIEYQASYRINGGNFTALPRTASNYIEVRDAQAGDYEFEVRAVGVTQRVGQPVALKQAIFGKLAPPADPTGLKVERRAKDLLLSWLANTDADLAGYEVRVGPSWDTGEAVGQTDGTQLVHDQGEAATYYYHLRAYDTTGNYSRGVCTFALELTAPQPVFRFDVIQCGTRLEFRWQPNPEPEVIAYELREGKAWDTGLLLAEIKSTSFTLPAGYDGVRKFWIKAIAAPGIYSETAAFVTTEVAQAKNANLLVSQDELEAGFPGVKQFAGVDSVNGVNVLRMQSGAKRSEYLFEIDLGPASIRAQNTLLTSLGASQDDRHTWASSNYTWQSPVARRQWTYDGSLENVSARFQISREDTLRETELYGWRLNDTLDGLGPSSLIEQACISYHTGRFANGLLLKDTSYVSWKVNVPARFHAAFWYSPLQVTTCTIWRLSASGHWLVLGYDSEFGRFFLEDQLDQRVFVEHSLRPAQQLYVGICQTATKRSLFIGQMGQNTRSAHAAFPALGAFETLSLY